jgi:PTH1 family peptidyl-tRNA hydrolase
VALRRSGEGGRRGSASTLVIVGLANPGDEYAGSRHNVGGDAVRLLAQRRDARLVLERRQRALSATIPTTRGPVTLAVPITYMNESGAALPPLLKRTSLEDLTRLIVAHDDLDLEPGRLQLKFGGGLAGHNGLRSIAQVLSTQRPTGARKVALRADVERAADALEALVDSDFDAAQREINAGRD